MTIDSMRTYFARPGHEPVDAVWFADAVLGNAKRAIADQINRLGFSALSAYATLEVALGDPAKPTDPPLVAYVNHGEWKVKCDQCGGCEYVDLELPITICCSCWNAAFGHQWRRVVLPDAATRADVEAVLLARPDRANQNWKSTESVADLERENAERGL